MSSYQPDYTNTIDIDNTIILFMKDEQLLSIDEKYTLFGTTNGPNNIGYSSWLSMIFEYSKSFYKKHNYIPYELGRIELQDISSEQDPISLHQALQFIRSPISGNIPSLDEHKFSRGNILITTPTTDEMLNMCRDRKDITDFLLRREVIDVDSKSKETTEIDKIFYIRVYGDSDVILEAIAFLFKNE